MRKVRRAEHSRQRSAPVASTCLWGPVPPVGVFLCETRSCSVAASPGLGHCHLSPAGASSLSPCFYSRPHLHGVTLLSGRCSSQSGPALTSSDLQSLLPTRHPWPSSRQCTCPHPGSPPTRPRSLYAPLQSSDSPPSSQVSPSEAPSSSPMVPSVYPALVFGPPLCLTFWGLPVTGSWSGSRTDGWAPGSLLTLLEQAGRRGGSGRICGARERRANEVRLVTRAMGGGEGCGHSPSGIRPSRVKAALRSSSSLQRPSDPDPLAPGRWTPTRKTSLGSHG